MACGQSQAGRKREWRMRKLTRWQKSAATRSHPLLLTIPFGGAGLAIMAYSLSKYGFSRQLLVGLCVALVYTLFWKWLFRRYLRYYVDRELGLRVPDFGIVALQTVPLGLLMAALAIVRDLGRDRWTGYGAVLFAMLLLYPELKALHEGIKARLAEMQSTPQQESAE